MPRYQELPNEGLYLEQTTQYINHVLAPLGCIELTSSMISNYVKKGLVDRSIKKKYYRDQIASLMFVAIAKTVLSIDRIHQLFVLQVLTYDKQTAYEYMRLELANIIEYVFGLKDDLDEVGVTSSDEKEMLRYALMTFAPKIYLELCLEAVSQEEK